MLSRTEGADEILDRAHFILSCSISKDPLRRHLEGKPIAWLQELLPWPLATQVPFP
jgi:hypothetical protein